MIHLAIYTALLLGTSFGAVAPPLSRRLPPGWAVWVLSGGSLLAAGASSGALALLAFPLVAQMPLLAAEGHWSDAVLRSHAPAATPVALLCLFAVLAMAAGAGRALVRRGLAYRQAARLAKGLPGGTELVVVDDPAPDAFAVPGWKPRTVLTTGILRHLDPQQRRAVLAHERSHLRHHHHLHASIVAVAAAVHPALRRLPEALELACERQADEDAAAASARATVATTLAVTALAGGRRPRGTRPGVVLAAASSHVLVRVAALAAPAPRVRTWPVAAAATLLAATTAAALLAAHETEQLFEFAQACYRGARSAAAR